MSEAAGCFVELSGADGISGFASEGEGFGCERVEAIYSWVIFFTSGPDRLGAAIEDG
jgi:hypothetical protein